MYNMDISIGSYKVRLEILGLIVVVFSIMFGYMLCGCSNVSAKEGFDILKGGVMSTLNILGASSSNGTSGLVEGFTSANNGAFGPGFAKAKSPDYITKPSKWNLPNLTYSPGTTPNASVQAIWDRPKQPIPLPKDEMYMFATTQFKPECCPNTFTGSTGCACMTVDQYNYLINRGGNNVPYSEY
jgi:hypothetical protein